MKFTDFNLHSDLQKGIDEAGYITCMPVQKQVISHVFGVINNDSHGSKPSQDYHASQDLYVQSQTGTGKTAAFLIVIFERMLTEETLFKRKALIMAPTRELAVQIEEEAKILSKYLPFKTGAFYGGVGYAAQEKLLRDNVQILVGTPGRVLDLNKSGKMNLMDISFLVLDEADRMFDMGFYPDLRKLIKVVPAADRRQTMLFSATLNAWVKNLAWEYTKSPHEIEIEPEVVTVEEITQILYHVPSEEKMPLLLGILKREQPESAIIFCNTKKNTEIVAKRLKMNGYTCEFIIGDLPQVKRLKVIDNVKSGKIKMLVATDVAARGLDIESLSMVINYDVPSEAENYVHRIGRTARAGKTGKAITLSSERDVYELPAIERYIGKKIPSEIAMQENYADDKSAGLRIQTDRYEDRPKDNKKREFTKKSSRGHRTGTDTETKGRGSPLAGSTETQRDFKNKSSRRDAETQRSQREYKRKETQNTDLSKLSMEDRMAVYKKKYSKSHSSSPASSAPPRLRESSSLKDPKPEKKGILSKLFGIFKKKENK
ncbi:MAG: DEAD/DEAH box helicase [Treponema sp.]|nr:DEAD/DEAH box helicase [Treponema sp.]